MLGMLFNIVIQPLVMVAEFIYVVLMKIKPIHGIAIAGLSIAMSILVLPLYQKAEAIQNRERTTRKRLQGQIDRIKSAFNGDEQYMMLRTLYRQQHYHPIFVLRSSIGIIIQVPIFIAAYHFLIGLEALNSTPFLFIRDLGKPDGLLHVFGRDFNVLPLVMTLINILSGYIYTKEFEPREKIQVFLMAGVFLVLLYGAPSGLVYYWTLNNLFSLGKNLFMRLKRRRRILNILVSILAILVLFFVLFTNETVTTEKVALLWMVTLVILLLPVERKLVLWVYDTFLSDLSKSDKDLFRLVIVSVGALWLLVGLVIPSNIISSSPVEFSDIGNTSHPIWYLFSVLTVSFGVVVFWPLVFYRMFGNRIKTMLVIILGTITLVSVVNLLVFKGDYGTVNSLLQFDSTNNFSISSWKSKASFGSMAVILFLVLMVVKKRKYVYLSAVFSVLIIASIVIGSYNIHSIDDEYRIFQDNIAKQGDTGTTSDGLDPKVTLSRSGKNVVVIFLDRAIGSYFPYILEEQPRMQEMYEGFVYYPNAVSFGKNTRMGAPPIMGGYEYTPDRINERKNESLITKHNEAMLVLPLIFSDAGFHVTVTDPPLSNYAWKGDHTPFQAYPEIEVHDLIGRYNIPYWERFGEGKDEIVDISTVIRRNLPYFSLLMIVHPALRSIIYDSGQYLAADDIGDNSVEFLNSYTALFFLPEITHFMEDGGTYTFLANNTTHEPQILIPPDYIPGEVHEQLVGGERVRLEGFHVETYHSNATAYLLLGKWLNTLKDEGVYNNTKIVIVSDHGSGVPNPSFNHFSMLDPLDISYFDSLLLFKDFNSDGRIKFDDTFMTSADVPLLAINDLPVSQDNPFTKKNLFSQIAKTEVNLYTGPWAVHRNSGNVFEFDLSQSFSVKDNIFVESNWKPLDN